MPATAEELSVQLLARLEAQDFSLVLAAGADNFSPTLKELGFHGLEVLRLNRWLNEQAAAAAPPGGDGPLPGLICALCKRTQAAPVAVTPREPGAPRAGGKGAWGGGQWAVAQAGGPPDCDGATKIFVGGLNKGDATVGQAGTTSEMLQEYFEKFGVVTYCRVNHHDEGRGPSKGYGFAGWAVATWQPAPGGWGDGKGGPVRPA
eukprot:gene2426-3474_t